MARAKRSRNLKTIKGNQTSAQPGAGLLQADLVIFTSPTGRAPWHPVKPEEVPDWVRHPDVMRRLVDGEECMDCTVAPAGSNWYRAIRASEINESMKGDH